MENDDQPNGMEFGVIVAHDATPSMQVPDAVVIRGKFTEAGASAMVKLVLGPPKRQQSAVVEQAAIRKWESLGRPSEPILLQKADFL